jgi:hypothetical protein
VRLKDQGGKIINMHDHPSVWRRELRLQTLVGIAKKELQLGKEFDEFSDSLEQEMTSRWRLVSSTRKLYLGFVKKVLDNQLVLNVDLYR